MASPSLEPTPQSSDNDDYDVIQISLNWGFLSLLAFLTIVTFQMFGTDFLHLRLTHVIFSTLVLAPVGFVLGLIGLKFGRSPQIARVGVFLNGVVIFCVLVLLPLTFAILRRIG
ncbi:MAG: hypothetical protein AAF560_12200 [Acidobacteriota bacterium]